ncbi:MAG: hypothetical protein JST16_10060 [Bdellovibrionales bacterium]|nr:hypothetical protein [Bdellovibrionales bacterium]
MKILEILLAFLATQGRALFQSNTEAVSQRIVNNARRVAVLISATVIFIVLFCVGFKMAYVAGVAGFDSGITFMPSPALWGGILLALVSLGGLVYCLSEKRWLDAVAAEPKATEEAKEAGPSPMENALAAILTEIAHEIHARRKANHRASAESPSSESTSG